MPFRLKKRGKAIFLVSTLLVIVCIEFSSYAIQFVHSADDFAPWLGDLSKGGNNLGAARPLNVSSPCTINKCGEAWNGYLAYGVFLFNSSDIWQVLKSYLIIMSTDGNPALYRAAKDQSYFAVKYVSQNRLLFQGETGVYAHFWDLRTNQTIDLPKVWGHHDIDYNPVNNTFLTLQYYVRRVNGVDVLFDKIVEFDANGTTLWSWDTYNYIPVSEACPFNDTFPTNGEDTMDLTHSNTLEWDYNNNIVYLNVRNVNTFYKISMTTGNIIWGCGEYGNFTLFDENGQKVHGLWYHSHSVKEVEPDVFIMFDNDYHNQTDVNDNHSRIIELTLNEKNMTARISWNWVAPGEYWSIWGGDADRLPNGDRIGTFGAQTHFVQNSTGAVLVEVNPKGQVVRTFTFPYGVGIYRVEHIALETFSDYDGAWRTTDFHVNLAAVNDFGGLSGTYYRINRGATHSVNVDGQPRITVESANNSLEYWSVDGTGLEEFPHRTLTGIKLDETPPSVSLSFPLNGSQVETSNVTATWAGSDTTSGISEYEISLDTGSCTNTGTNTAYNFSGLRDGNHTISVRAFDVAGNNQTISASFAVNTVPVVQPTPTPTVQPTPGPTAQPNWTYAVIAVILVAAAIAVAAITLGTRKNRKLVHSSGKNSAQEIDVSS